MLAGYLRRVRAVDADADQILVCSGMAQGLSLVLQSLGRASRRARGSRRHRDGGRGRDRHGQRCVPVRVDELGIDVAALAATDARVVVVTPAHQWPTGVVLAPSAGTRWSRGRARATR